MASASNTPRTPLTLELEQRKSVSFGVSFVDTANSPVNILESQIRMVVRPYNDQQDGDVTAAIDLEGTVTEGELGYARFDVQAADLDLTAGQYEYAIILEDGTGYTSVVVKGDMILLRNTEFDSALVNADGSGYPAFNIKVTMAAPDPLTTITGVPYPNQVPFTEGDRAEIEQLNNRVDAIESGGQVLTVEGIGPDSSGNIDLDVPFADNPLIVLETGAPLPAPTLPGTVIGRIDPLVTDLEVVAGSAEDAIDTDTTLDIPVPADAISGDYLVAAVTSQNTGATWTAPVGWDTLASYTTGDNRSLYVFGYPITGSVPAGPETFTVSSGGRDAGVMFRVLGVDLTDALLVAGTGSTGRTANFVTIPQLAGSAGGLVLSIHCGNNGAGVPYPIPATWSNGMTSFVDAITRVDNAAALTWIDVAATTTVIDFNEHVITSGGGSVTQMGGAAIALRGA
jgi:hypothetical protein